MDIGGTVQQLAQDTGEALADAAKGVAGGVAQQAKSAVDPLSILEEILGGSSASAPATKEKGTAETGGAGGGADDAAAKSALEQKIQTENQQKEAHLQLHRQRMMEEQQRYQSVKAQEEQVRQQAQQQEEAQKKFQIEQLSRQKKENLAVKIAQESAGAEKKNWGAG